MGTVFLHEIADQLKSLRFQVSLVTLLMFFVANGVIYSMKMDRDVIESARIAADMDRQFEDPGSIGDAATRWYRVLASPTGTEFITEGGYNWFTDTRQMNPRSGWGLVFGDKTRTINMWMRKFEIVDWTVIVRLVLSFLCVVLAYDAISGPLGRGTLRLTLANPISRGRLLAGRVLAQWTSLMAATTLGACISLAILALEGVLSLDAVLAGKVAAFLVATGLYVAFYLLLSTGVSALARSSAAALVVMVLAWAVLTVVIPQTAYLIGSRAEKDTVSRSMGDQAWQVLRDAEEAMSRDGIRLRFDDRDGARADGFALEKQYLRGMADVEKIQARLLRDYDARQVRQFRAARRVNLMSPGFAYQYGVEGLLGTGLARRQDFIEQAWRYREILRDYIRTQDAADPDSPHIAFLGAFMSTEPFDEVNRPRFRQRELPFDRGFSESVVPAVVLSAEVALAFFFAFGVFLRMDLTGNE